MARVRADGPLDAPLGLIGEAPGRVELQQGRPFVGPSGFIMSHDWWAPVGLRRRDFRVYNVFEYGCPKSNIALARRDEVEAWSATLHSRLAEMTQPRVLVPTGNVALRTMMRQPLWSQRSPKITDWRGSILRYEFEDGRWCKMIPTIHPAAALRDTSLWKLCAADWKRIAREVDTKALRIPERTHLIPPLKTKWVNRYVLAAADRGEVMAIDIETPRRKAGGPRHIECVAFAYTPNESLTLGWPEHKDLIRMLCESTCTKVGQNFLFDRFWLAQVGGIEMGGEVHDILSMDHAIDATVPHDLGTQASLHTRQPYWKRSAKDLDLDEVEQTPRDRLMAYCGLDSCVTRELFDVHAARLKGDTP